MLVIGAILILQLGVSLSFYVSIDRETAREDHARRVAELLMVSQRVHALGAADVGEVMTTSYLEVARLPARPPSPGSSSDEAQAVRKAIVRWEPELLHKELLIWTKANELGGLDLVGAMRLDDGQWLSFRSRDLGRMWPTAVRVTWMTILLAVLCLVFAVFVLKQMGRPLRDLAHAARAFGRAPHAPVDVEGSTDELRDLGRAFNEMQDRITGLMADQARSMEAISHDLRTPLARMQLATEFAEPADVRQLFDENVRELDQMLNSLSAFLRAQHQESEAEMVDLAALARSIVDCFGDQARYEGPKTMMARTYRAPIEEALRRMIDNAVRHAGEASVTLVDGAEGPQIKIRDHGGGMAPADLEHIFEPFFRADPARARNTAGFGLGVPTAARLLAQCGGALAIANASDGGLLVTITAPRLADPPKDQIAG
ncbi:ATP-binding protein [Caulobacter sp. NIBR2454]|uniref:ATP-binding protein n=1 Tax=Caulobacter sp. NIBR2454 TaxID=3015996 RepID=UPI0022B7404D|nr:ATP-binding protein [Caulobacter sp. NIBR2454]